METPAHAQAHTAGIATISAPTVREIDEIGAIEDAAVRNLRITHCYHELSLAFARYTGAGANWCTFATWASRQAGQSIRREDLAAAIDQVFGSSDVRRLLERLVRLVPGDDPAQRSVHQLAERIKRALGVEAALERVSAAVANGNRKVFIIDQSVVRALLTRIDPTPNSTAQSGATDWANLSERIHFIADFFRCWHLRSELSQPPSMSSRSRQCEVDTFLPVGCSPHEPVVEAPDCETSSCSWRCRYP